MEIMELIDQLETLAGGSRKVPITGKTMVNGEKLRDLIDQMRLSIPEDIKQASEILEYREQIITKTASEARKLKVSAERDAKNLIDDSELVASAKRRSEEIIKVTEERGQKIMAAIEEDVRSRRRGADEYVRQTLVDLDTELTSVLETIRRGIDSVTPKEIEEPFRAAS